MDNPNELGLQQWHRNAIDNPNPIKDILANSDNFEGNKPSDDFRNGEEEPAKIMIKVGEVDDNKPAEEPPEEAEEKSDEAFDKIKEEVEEKKKFFAFDCLVGKMREKIGELKQTFEERADKSSEKAKELKNILKLSAKEISKLFEDF